MLLALASPRREATSDNVSAALDQLVSREIYPELDGPTCEIPRAPYFMTFESPTVENPTPNATGVDSSKLILRYKGLGIPLVDSTRNTEIAVAYIFNQCRKVQGINFIQCVHNVFLNTRFYPSITSLIPKALLRETVKKPETLYDLVEYISKEVFYLTFPFTFMHSSLMHKLDTKDLEIVANPLQMDVESN
ncbi:hypothetical protein V1478_010526 [Vespula squamosa]|uniref:Uncharacterized protein n=1 Tax=Vespula squamosa TaxID=30214 RepID=A0ABD2AKQ3_VESSQ